MANDEAGTENAGNPSYLFFDTETTGLPKSWKASFSDSGNWPHIVQIAWALFDGAGKQIAFRDYIVRPEGFVIPESATAIHGISTEKALREGCPAAQVLKEFSEVIRGVACLVAHNLDFDEKMVRVELLRHGMPDVLQGVPLPINRSVVKTGAVPVAMDQKKIKAGAVKKICTMKSSAAYCKIPGPYGNKWPKLSELHVRLFNVDFQDQHNAASDVLCCAKCFFELKRLAVICDSPNTPF
ncbi:MAG: 3'-5' exonuclease [Candidatus Omnitrophota bacterium]|jgi:DNA polymerase III epsilon subunit-like protein